MKRYDMKATYNHIACEDQVVEVESSDGQYVKFSDYAELAAQVEQLRSGIYFYLESNSPETESKRWNSLHDLLQQTPAQCLAEHDREVAARVVEGAANHAIKIGGAAGLVEYDDLIEYANKIKSGEVKI